MILDFCSLAAHALHVCIAEQIKLNSLFVLKLLVVYINQFVMLEFRGYYYGIICMSVAMPAVVGWLLLGAGWY